jgi:hypothetical protein
MGGVQSTTPTGQAAANSGTRLFAIWMFFCAFCHTAGWALSAAHALNRGGYALAFLVGAGALFAWAKQLPQPTGPGVTSRLRARLRHRFRKPFPIAYLFLGILGLMGGALYAPSNFDALAYRTPRALQWIAEGQWHWIHTDFGNLNSRGSSVEWPSVPLFLFTGTDRFEFLFNVVCFLFLPGRVFAILTRLGASKRAAYYWMWIFACGYGFVLQVGSIANDMYCALWPMAAVEFALRARETKRLHFVWLSVVAAALMSSSKAFNLLLAPAWCLALLPALPLLLRRPLATAGIVIFATTASIVPTALLNVKYCGDWTGLAAEPVKFDSGPPLFHIPVNLVLTALYNFAPPIFPLTGAWNKVVTSVIPADTQATMQKYFEPDAARLSFGEMQIEEAAGLGLGVSLLLVAVALCNGAKPSRWRLFRYETLIAIAAFGGLLIFMARSGLSTPARYSTPFYLFIIAPILTTAGAAMLARQRWWRRLALCMFPMAALLLIASPPRPLFPAVTLLRAAGAETTSNGLLQRAWRVYGVYTQRRDLFRPVREALPPGIAKLGLVAFNVPETSLWKPFGARRILHIKKEDSPEQTRARGIEFVLINPEVVASTDDWVAKFGGEVTAKIPLQVVARNEPVDWLLVRLRP